MSNGQRAPWNNVDVAKCTRSICNEDIFWYWKNLIKSGVYVKELFREKYISMYISYISHLFIHLQKNVLNVCEDNLWLFWASRVTCEGDRCISIKLHCEARHDVLGLALNILPVLIPVEIWFIPGGGEEDKVPDQIDTVETISAGVITSELTWHWHTSGQECVVCVQFCF